MPPFSLPPLPPPVPVDPDVLFLIFGAGAIIGGLSAAATYVIYRSAEQQGSGTAFFPEFPPFLVHRVAS